MEEASELGTGSKRNAPEVHKMIHLKWFKIIGLLLSVSLLTCTNNMTGVLEHYIYGHNFGDLIDQDGDGKSDGIDSDKDGQIDMVFVSPQGPPVTGIDIDGNKQADFYLLSDGSGLSKINTKKDGSGIQVVMIYSGGRFTGFDLNGDGVPDSSITVPSGVTYTIGGNVTGLVGDLVISIDSGIARELMLLNGVITYTGAIPVPENSYYLVKIEQQPATVNCTINNSAGIAIANVINADIVCNYNAVSNQGFGTSIDNNADGIADGIDIDGDSVIDMLFTTPLGPNTWGIDPGGGATAFYMYISGGSVLLNTIVDVAGVATGNPVSVIYDAGNQFIGYDTNGDGFTDLDTAGAPVVRYKLTGTYHTNAGAPETTVLGFWVNGAFVDYIPANADLAAITSPVVLLPGDLISLTVENTTAYRCTVENGSGTAAAADWTGADVYCGTYGRTLDGAAFLAGYGVLLDSPVPDGLIDAIDLDGNSTYTAGVDMTLIPTAGIYGDGISIPVDVDTFAGAEFHLFVDGSGSIFLSLAADGSGPFYTLKRDGSNNPIGYDTDGDTYRDKDLSWGTILRSDIKGSVSCTGLDPYTLVLALTVNGTDTYYLTVNVGFGCASTSYSFASVLPAGGVEETHGYSVSVFNSNGATCTFSGTSKTGVMPAVDVININISCL